MAKDDQTMPFVVSSHNIHTDVDYLAWLVEPNDRYRTTQIKAVVKVNSQQFLFKWQLERDLVVRKVEEKWGNGIVEQISLDFSCPSVHLSISAAPRR